MREELRETVSSEPLTTVDKRFAGLAATWPVAAGAMWLLPPRPSRGLSGQSDLLVERSKNADVGLFAAKRPIHLPGRKLDLRDRQKP